MFPASVFHDASVASHSCTFVQFLATHSCTSREWMQTHSLAFRGCSSIIDHFNSRVLYQESRFRSVLRQAFMVMFLLITFCIALFLSSMQQATWIWYPGDFEIWLSNKMQNRRTERGTFFPVFWKVDNHYLLMDFHKVFELTEPEEVDYLCRRTIQCKAGWKAIGRYTQ